MPQDAYDIVWCNTKDNGYTNDAWNYCISHVVPFISIFQTTGQINDPPADDNVYSVNPLICDTSEAKCVRGTSGAERGGPL